MCVWCRGFRPWCFFASDRKEARDGRTEKRREKSIKWGRRPYGQGEASPANQRGASQRSSQLIIPSGCFQLMGSSPSLRLPYINAPSTCEYLERILRHLNSISSVSVGALDGVPRLVAPLSFLKKDGFFSTECTVYNHSDCISPEHEDEPRMLCPPSPPLSPSSLY